MRWMGLLAVLGCSESTQDKTNNDSAIEVLEPPTSVCVEGHDWLPIDKMGQLVSSEQDLGLSFEKETINTLLASNGLTEFGQAQNGVQTFRVQYISQDRGKEIVATGFVFLPIVDEPTKMPMILYAHPLMGFSDQCAPTAIGLEGAAVPLLMSSMGFVTVAPDYLNMRGFGESSDQIHPVALAEPAAVLSLDSLRSALNLATSEDSDAQPDPEKVIFWGVSEGGFTTLWSERYRPMYAPSFETVGIVAAIPPSNLLGIAQRATSTLSQSTPALAAVLVGMDQWYENDSIADFLAPNLVDVIPTEMMESCDEFPSVANAAAISDFFNAEFIDAVSTENWTAIETQSCQLRENSLVYSHVPLMSDTPTLIVTAENDDLAWPQPVHQDIPALCDQGYQIDHIQCAGADHVEGAVETLPLQLAWIQARVAGEVAESDCIVNPPINCATESN